MMKQRLIVCVVLGLLGLTLGSVLWATTETSQIEITVSPKVLVLGSAAVWVTVHTDMRFSAVDVDTVGLTLNGVPVTIIKSDARGYLVAKFNSEQVKDIVDVPDATLTLTGATADGVEFSGTDTIAVRL